MSQFLGTHPNKLDAKGRVSIPASFRTALRNGAGGNGDGETSLVLRPHHTHRCIDGFAANFFHTLASSMARLDLFSADQEDLAIALYAEAVELVPDKEGRIVLPQNLIAWAGLEQGATFVGMGRQFQIWSPEAAARRAAEARLGVQSRHLAVPAPGASPNVLGAAP